MDGGALRIFVAMPGTDMGPHAEWRDIAEIKQHLLMPVRDRLATGLGRQVTLAIETDKRQSGDIYGSMFAEAVEADIYIADLSGNNPNVFLELGVRWAMADNTTILITQDPEQVARRFNVASARAIRYGQGPGVLGHAIEQIVATAELGLSGHVDSIVRPPLKVVTVSREAFAQLEERIRSLEAERGEDLVVAARAQTGRDAVASLRRAVALNPANADAWYQLGVRLRRLGEHAEAATCLRRSLDIDGTNAEAWRELGVAYSTGEMLDEAIEAFERSLSHHDSAPETWANLAGLHRRVARQSDGTWDLVRLSRSAECYERASELNRNDTYPRLNAAKVQLLLVALRPSAGDIDAVLGDFERLRRLAEFTIEDLESRRADGVEVGVELTWKHFDLVDCLLMTGSADEVHAALDRAIDSILPGELVSQLASVVEPWRDFAALAALGNRQKDNIDRALRRCEQAIATAAT